MPFTFPWSRILFATPIPLGAADGEHPETTTLAESPLAIGMVAAGWLSTGLVVAYLLHRRGHEFRTMAVLGAVLGPLFIGLAAHYARHRERVAPIPLSTGQRSHGPIDILVGLDGGQGSPEELRSALRMFESRRGRVTLVRAIDFESADDDDWSDAKAAAAAELESWASCVPGDEPSTVLIPGPPEHALADYAVREGYGLLILVGGWHTKVLHGRHPSAEELPIPVLILPPPVSGPDRRGRDPVPSTHAAGRPPATGGTRGR